MTKTMIRRVKIADIVVGKRSRQDLGDLAALAQSIEERGLINLIAVWPDLTLAAGERRLHAIRKLGWTHVEVHVLGTTDDLFARLGVERDENVCREPLLPSEAVALGRKLEEAARKEAKERQKDHGKTAPGKRKNTSAKLAEVKGEARDQVADAVGMRHTSYRKAAAVVEAAEEDPATFGDLPGQMDESENVHQAFQELKRRQKRQELARKAAAAPPLNPDTARVALGHCLDVMADLKKSGQRFRLGFADYQYNQGVDFGNGKKADLLPRDEYLALCSQWMTAVVPLLTPDGSFWVLISPEYAAEFKILLEATGLSLADWIIWYETFGVNNPHGFNRTHRHLFWSVKDPQRFVFHADAVNRPSDRQQKYKDRRADPGGKTWDSVWGIDPPIPRLTGTCAERIPDFPTQLPLALLLPIIGCASDPGDLVLDPFSGSATTGAAALQLGRRYVGIEQNPRYVELSRQRLASLVVTENGRQGRKAARKKGPAK
jgi:site-specific DNA-methyltransferase (adenine-specific)